MLWTKSRNAAYAHLLYDSVRGAGNSKSLNLGGGSPAGTGAEGAAGDNATYGYLNSFDANGFSYTKGSAGTTFFNQSGINYVAWCWKAGGAAVSNSDGTITSSVSANTEAGFSIVSYTGNNATGATVGHGLGKVPKWIIVKDRDTAGYNWHVYHDSIGATKELKLNTLAAESTQAFWNNTAPTSSVFTVNGGGWEVNTDTKKHIAYCWAEIPGYSKFGSYTGNGSTNGVYVHLGFKPAFIITKQTNGTGSWFIFDNKRNGYNETEPYVMSNVTNVEATDLGWDFLSHGFKHRNSYAATNGSGNTFIYMAFAEQPGATPFDTFANSR